MPSLCPSFPKEAMRLYVLYMSVPLISYNSRRSYLYGSLSAFPVDSRLTA